MFEEVGRRGFSGLRIDIETNGPDAAEAEVAEKVPASVRAAEGRAAVDKPAGDGRAVGVRVLEDRIDQGQ